MDIETRLYLMYDVNIDPTNDIPIFAKNYLQTYSVDWNRIASNYTLRPVCNKSEEEQAGRKSKKDYPPGTEKKW